MTFGEPTDRPTPPSHRPRRSRARTLVLLAVAGWAVLEIWLLTVVAGWIGAGPVLLLLLAGLVLGGLAVRRAGRRAWNSLAAAVRASAPDSPDAPRPDGPLPRAEGAGTAMLGGLLLMVPGFVSDAVGLLCLFPPTRRLLVAGAGLAGRRLGGREPAAGSFGDGLRQARMRMPDGKVVQGEVVHDEPRDRPGDHRNGDDPDGPGRPPLTP